MVSMNPYTLPQVDFIGGSTQEIECSVLTYDGSRQFNLSGCEAYFSLINYADKSGGPVIYKNMKIEQNGNNIYSSLRVQLSPEETMKLFGKYIYQISIHDSFGNIDNRQGVMYIINNINKNYM